MPYYFAPITIQAFKKLPLYFKEHINQIYSYFTINGVTAKDLHGGCELEALPDDEVIQLAYLKVGQQEHSKKKMVNETEALFHVFIESVETSKIMSIFILALPIRHHCFQINRSSNELTLIRMRSF